jgi:hypothetical protein
VALFHLKFIFRCQGKRRGVDSERFGAASGVAFGAGIFLIPGVGPVLIGEPFLAALVGALESAAVLAVSRL